MRVLESLCIVGLLAASARAQGRAGKPAGVVRPRTVLMAGTAPSADSSRAPTLVPRALLGTAGAVGGVFAGALLGVTLIPIDCHCDDPGLPQALLGAAVGSVIAGAAVSAIPEFGSRCRYAGRFGRALIGSAIGALVGGIASGGSELILVTYPVGAGAGAAIGANSC